MFKVIDFLEYIDKIAPFCLSYPFDNTGLIIGDLSADAKKVLVCLDLTRDTADFAVSNKTDLIICHHPLIFDPLKSVKKGDIVYELIQNHISVIAAHTNLDSAENGVADILCEILELTNIENITDDRYPNCAPYARSGEIKAGMNPGEFAVYVKNKIKCDSQRVLYSNSPIKKVAVCPGSGASMLQQISDMKYDAFISSEFKHEHWIAAKNSCLTLIDCGHFWSEIHIVSYLSKKLKDVFKIEIIDFAETPPYSVI